MTFNLIEIVSWLIAAGSLGLFIISFIDSALIAIPTGPDLMVISMSSVSPYKMPLYAFIAALGSTSGCYALFLTARWQGMRVLTRLPYERRQRINDAFNRHGLLILVVPSLVPIPFPFKTVVLLAGVLTSPKRFLSSIFVGRLIRYLIEGGLAIQFGNDAGQLIAGNTLLIIVTILTLSLGSLAIRYLRSHILRTKH